MFTLSEIQNKRRVRGASLCSMSVWQVPSYHSAAESVEAAFALVGVGALGLYGWELVAILRARKATDA
jgi:hypothetical protein